MASFISGPEWNLVIRGGAEAAVMAIAATWFLRHLKHGLWAIAGAFGAGVYAVLYGVLTVGSIQTRTAGAEPDWLTSLYEHYNLTDWIRIAGLAMSVFAFMVAFRQRRTTG